MATIRKVAQVAWAVLFWVLLVCLAVAILWTAVSVGETAWILLRVSLGAA
jgi:hypothetical protein